MGGGEGTFCPLNLGPEDEEDGDSPPLRLVCMARSTRSVDLPPRRRLSFSSSSSSRRRSRPVSGKIRIGSASDPKFISLFSSWSKYCFISKTSFST